MAMDTSEVLDLTKENIQPLRQGRKAAILKTALQAQTDPQTQQMLLKQREEYEYKIRMYEGDDPLEVYYSYAIWLEQSFLKMGRECNLVALLEDILIKFKDCAKYKQDQRLAQLLVKYISVQSNPIELYQLVYDQGLGTMCSLVYKAWAEEFDKINDIKRADQVYQLGINCRAQPLTELENAHVQFQLSIARRMIEGTLNSNPLSSEESHRLVLSRLKPSKVNTTRATKDRASLLPPTKNLPQKLTNFSTPKFQVYTEDENDKPRKVEIIQTDRFPKGSVANRENTMQAGKWNNQKQRQSYKMSLIPTTPSFKIHIDPEADYKTMKSDFKPRALKVRKDDFNPPVAVFEPQDDTKKPMYPKQMVYVGGRDVQLEEIRAALYWKKMEKLEEKNLKNRGNTHIIHSGLINEVHNDDQSVEVGFFVQQHVGENINQRHKLTSDTDTSKLNQLKNDVLLEQIAQCPLDNVKIPSAEKDAVVTKDCNDLLPRGENSHMLPKDFGLHPITFGKSNSFKPMQSLSTSVTVNTRNAIHIIDEMWKSDSSQNGDVDNFLLPTSTKIPSFPVCTDSENKVPIQKANIFPVFCDENVASPGQDPFSVFRDCDTKNEKQSDFDTYCNNLVVNRKLPTKRNAYENPFAVFCDDDASEENAGIGLLSCDGPNSKQDIVPNFASLGVFCDTNAKLGQSSFPICGDEIKNLCDDRQNVGCAQTTGNIYFDHDCNDEELARPMGLLGMNSKCTPVAVENPPLPCIVKVDLDEKPLGPEDKENMAPKTYLTPNERRPLSGILTPATNVSLKENQSDESDEDENRECERCLNFDDETCTTRAFAIPLPGSTPYSRPETSKSSRKSSVYDGSYLSEGNHPWSGSDSRFTQKTSCIDPLFSNSKKMNLYTSNLSLILENSKELKGSSSSSSGTVGSMRSHYTPFT